MLRALVILHRRPDLTREEFTGHFREVHAPLALALPGLRGYRQLHVRSVPFGGQAPCDAVAELWFDNEAALRAAFDSPAGAAALADNALFTDDARTKLVVVDEVDFGMTPLDSAQT
jgi:uncharacterized protein (TIGR02118 family)